MKKAGVSARQMRALFFVGALSPGIRLIPASLLSAAGSAAWLSPAAAMLPGTLYSLLLAAVWRRIRPGERPETVLARAVGRVPAGILLAAVGLWLSLYAGFLLRISADRLLSTIYRGASGWGLMAVSLALAAACARGGVRNLARTARTLLPVLGAVLFLSCALAAGDVRPERLFPVTGADVPGILLGAVPVWNVISVSAYLLLFSAETEAERPSRLFFVSAAGWTVLAALWATLSVVGTLTAPLAATQANPFFIMIRNLTVFGASERVEAVVIGLWLVTDLTFLGLLLAASGTALRGAVGGGGSPAVYPAAAGAALGALLCGDGALALYGISRVWVPVIHLFFTGILFPLVCAAGEIRRRLRRRKG